MRYGVIRAEVVAGAGAGAGASWVQIVRERGKLRQKSGASAWEVAAKTHSVIETMGTGSAVDNVL